MLPGVQGRAPRELSSRANQMRKVGSLGPSASRIPMYVPLTRLDGNRLATGAADRVHRIRGLVSCLNPSAGHSPPWTSCCQGGFSGF